MKLYFHITHIALNSSWQYEFLKQFQSIKRWEKLRIQTVEHIHDFYNTFVQSVCTCVHAYVSAYVTHAAVHMKVRTYVRTSCVPVVLRTMHRMSFETEASRLLSQRLTVMRCNLSCILLNRNVGYSHYFYCCYYYYCLSL